METRPNSFPVYVSSQYLTSKQLNETTDFLWQEEKAARYLLKGNGILQGFALSFTDGVSLKQISITAGSGCTVDGYIIQQTGNQVFDKGHAIDLSLITLPDNSQQLMEKADYDKVKDKLNATEKILNAIEIFNVTSNLPDLPDGSNTLDSMAIPAAKAVSDYTVFAGVFVKDDSYDNCQQGDCNDRGTERSYMTRLFLVLAAQFSVAPVPPSNTLSPQMPLCMATRIKGLSQVGSTAAFYQNSFTAWSTNFTIFQPYFAVASSGKQLSIISTLLDSAEKTAFTAAVAKFTAIVASANAAKCEQYYNAFASDLSAAINELVEFYNDYAKKYPNYPQARIEGALVLGGLKQGSVDKWRYYFLPAGDQPAFTFDRNRLKQLFMRAVSLVNNFVTQDIIKTQAAKINKVLAIPSVAGDSQLAHRAIPYYYDVLVANNQILNNWNPQSGDLQNIFCYYDAQIPTRNTNPNMAAKLSMADWTNQGFFRIEGHLGLQKDAVISALNQMIVADDLPIQLIDCNVNYKGPTSWNNWYNDFSVFLNDSLKALKAAMADPNQPKTTYAYDPFKKMVANNLETSYRQPDKIKGIVDNLNAYSHVFYNAGNAKPGLAKPAAAGTATNPLSDPNVIAKYNAAVNKDKVLALIKGYNDALVEVNDPNVKKIVVLKDLAGLEYTGGVPKGGTFVLLHDGATVIGDGSLSYYYRINQSRIFDV
ncbi:hypothetical protein [Mucilaginibacter ginsenosidivorans]|uniref:Uncharacterized protein n=1 Tax=Mucilaginibacter ginsenosidivorans TaxID=398053 RepID=A0A5B8UXP1_9SPHI|nr:hypothetical protein [Mucilaginibacter ginsenosidivorans]QEC63722.1 hypothetical protein FRZ54_14450 [Mucilaginibacter ginsenosidivorans]